MKKLFIFFSLLFSAGFIYASEIPSDFSFQNNLEIGDTGPEVKYLQVFLNNYSNFKVASKGIGSSGNETEYFGALTKAAVVKFQESYFAEILAPWGFSKGTGMVSTTTRAKMNQILSVKNYLSEDFFLSSLYLNQGEVLVAKVFNVNPDEVVVADFLEKSYIFYNLGTENEKIAFIPISAKLQKGDYSISIYSSQGKSFFKELHVLDSNFPVTTLAITSDLEEEGYTPDSVQDNIIKENQTLFAAALNEPILSYYFREKFGYPLNYIENVGAYGNIRKSGDISLQHLGVDLEAEEGTEVYSINDGVVKFVKETTNYGKTIIIDHGGGIRSIYLHLSEFLVKEGELVSKGSLIAYSGNTGYSIAPHLHLSLNVYGISIDPLKFIQDVNSNL